MADGSAYPSPSQGYRAVSAPDWLPDFGPLDGGPAPMLQWIEVEHLVVDESYQRPIAGKGRQNVASIAERFEWSKFAPLIVSPVPGGIFAIIDGQHRATAAVARGATSLPAMVVIADRALQAQVFTAVNAGATPVSEFHLHRARLAAGDPRAQQLHNVAVTARVNITGNPTVEPGMTKSINTLKACLAAYGERTLTQALLCITGTRNNLRGALNSSTIRALCIVLDGRPDWRDHENLLPTFDKIDLHGLIEEAKRAAADQHGRVDRAHDAIARRLRERLKPILGAVDPRILASSSPPPPAREGCDALSLH